MVLFEWQTTSYMREKMQTSAPQGITDRMIEIYDNPCPPELTGKASPIKIEKGKKLTFTITEHCSGSLLASQLIQLSYSPDLSCDVMNKQTDSNGQITVKGKDEGNGILYAKAVSAIAPEKIVTEIPIKVGNGESWRITLDTNIKCSTSFGEDYANGYTYQFTYKRGEQSVEYTYTVMYDLSIPKKWRTNGKSYIIDILLYRLCQVPTTHHFTHLHQRDCVMPPS